MLIKPMLFQNCDWEVQEEREKKLSEDYFRLNEMGLITKFCIYFIDINSALFFRWSHAIKTGQVVICFNALCSFTIMSSGSCTQPLHLIHQNLFHTLQDMMRPYYHEEKFLHICYGSVAWCSCRTPNSGSEWCLLTLLPILRTLFLQLGCLTQS